jgi:hypothetical protein
MYECFISYSRRHSDLLEPISALLAARGRLFVDSEEIDPGDRWREKLEEALRDSKEVVVLWCCHAASRPWVARELELAKELDKKITPVLLCPAQLPPIAAEYQWIDFRNQVRHECTESCSGSEVVGRLSFELRTISPTDHAAKLGVDPLARTAAEASWKEAVRRTRLGLIVRSAESLATATIGCVFGTIVSALVSDIIGLPRYWVLLGGIAGLAVAIAILMARGLRSWAKFAGVQDLGLNAGETARFLALTIVSPPKQPVNAPSNDDAPTGCSCGCIIVIIITILAILAIVAGPPR